MRSVALASQGIFSRAAWGVLVAGALGTTGCGDDTSSTSVDESSSSTAGESSATIDPTADTSTSSVDESSSSSASTETTSVDTTESSGAPETTTSAEESSTDTSTSAVTAESSTTDPTDTDTDGGDVCPAGELGPALPDSVADTTSTADNDFTGSCGGAGAPDLAYTFTAPSTGPFTFDTMGSELDTVIYVLDGVCSGDELGCNDDGAGSQSALTVDLVQDQTVTVVVDGFSIFGDPFTLQVRQGAFACPAGDLGSTVPTEVSGDTTQFFDGFSSSCGGDDSQDAAYLFTAPQDGTYSFDTFGSAFEAIVYVLDGACNGQVLGCAIDGMIADLEAGQQVTVVVDGQFASGQFDLHVGLLGGMCPDDVLPSTVPQQILGNTSASDNTVGGSCGGAFSPDDTYLFTAPNDGLYSFDTLGSSYDTVLHVRDGACDGPESGCNDNINFNTTLSRVTQPMNAGETVLVSVDGNGAGAYSLNIDQIDCPDASLPSDTQQTAFNTTFNGINKLTGSCGGADSPDFAWSFTAPEDGEYVFDTMGTGFDTVLYVLDGAACNGTELACNDNFQAQQVSAVSVNLTAGQTVSVVVDGQFNAQGVFQLNVSQLGGGACPDANLGNMVPNGAQGNTSDGDNTVAGTCGGLSQPDDIYFFTAPAEGFYVFDTIGSGYDTVLIMRDGDCTGAEIGCNDNINFNTTASRISRTLEANQTVMVAVDGNNAGAYDLNIQQVACPDENIGNMAPDSIDGTTVGATDKLIEANVCFFQQDENSPDYVLEWTAPAAGLYFFDTFGSNYPAIFFIQDAACGGQQLACGSEFDQIGLNLQAGQTIQIVVTGYFGQTGDFTLNIDN